MGEEKVTVLCAVDPWLMIMSMFTNSVRILNTHTAVRENIRKSECSILDSESTLRNISVLFVYIFYSCI